MVYGPIGDQKLWVGLYALTYSSIFEPVTISWESYNLKNTAIVEMIKKLKKVKKSFPASTPLTTSKKNKIEK